VSGLSCYTLITYTPPVSQPENAQRSLSMLPCHDALVLCMLLADHTVCWQPLDHHTRNWDLIISVIFAGYCFSKYQTYYICVDSSLQFCCAADLDRNSALCQGRIGHCFATGLVATDDQVFKALYASSKPEKKHHWTNWGLVMVCCITGWSKFVLHYWTNAEDQTASLKLYCEILQASSAATQKQSQNLKPYWVWQPF
jgi:hypothetical protein